MTTVVASDPDASEVLTYSKTGGADQGLFTLGSGTGVLAFTSAPDFDLPSDANTDNDYVVEVTVTDLDGNTDVQTITVTIDDDNDNAPVFTTTATQSVAEAVDTVTVLATTDIDTVGTNPPTFTISGGVDAADFILVTGNTLTFAATTDYEVPADDNTDNDYVVEVQADDGVNTTTLTITVTVTDLNDIAPVFTSSDSHTVDEGVSTVVALATTDVIRWAIIRQLSIL